MTSCGYKSQQCHQEDSCNGQLGITYLRPGWGFYHQIEHDLSNLSIDYLNSQLHVWIKPLYNHASQLIEIKYSAKLKR